jgi:threonine/homoserine/homoserine lactone efflux protein
MPEPATLLVFAVTALLFAASPGPNFVFVLPRSVSHGRTDGLMSVLGIGTGALCHTLGAVFGLSVLLATSALAFSAVKIVGALYLLYLGIRVLLSSSHPPVAAAVGGVKRGAAYRQGLVTMLLNPKAAVYFLAFLPQFVDPSRGAASGQLLVLGTVQAAAAVVVYTAVAFMAAPVGYWLGRSVVARRVQKWFTGCTYVALGAGLALSGHKR